MAEQSLTMSEDRILSSVKFYNAHVLLLTIKKTKMKKKRPAMAHLKIYEQKRGQVWSKV